MGVTTVTRGLALRFHAYSYRYRVNQFIVLAVAMVDRKNDSGYGGSPDESIESEGSSPWRNIEQLYPSEKWKNLEILGILGEGAFGKVYRVKHRTDNHQYAVKLMPQSSETKARYQGRELELLTTQVSSSMTHKNIVKYYDSWFCDETKIPILCIQMELCSTNLENLLWEERHVIDDERFCQHVFKQILRGLEFIHGIHWVHRDIYPPNILTATPYQTWKHSLCSLVVKLADFGLARKLDEPCLTLSNPPDEVLSVVGNEFYRAPEMSNEKYDYKVDLFSAGVVLYRLCRYFNEIEEVHADLRQLQDKKGQVDKTKLCHQEKYLRRLLDDLLNQDPKNRPTASEALERFPKSETDGANLTSIARHKILVKRSSDKSYRRIHNRLTTFSTLEDSIRKLFDNYGSESCEIIEESCEQKIVNNKDVTAMLRSAEEKDCAVKLVVRKIDSLTNEGVDSGDDIDLT